jgi:hypothetical protein
VSHQEVVVQASVGPFFAVKQQQTTKSYSAYNGSLISFVGQSGHCLFVVLDAKLVFIKPHLLDPDTKV